MSISSHVKPQSALKINESSLQAHPHSWTKSDRKSVRKGSTCYTKWKRSIVTQLNSISTSVCP